jgi:hypothetical protein
MSKRTVGIVLSIKMFLVVLVSPILFALYQINKLSRNNPKEKPAKPFYE